MRPIRAGPKSQIQTKWKYALRRKTKGRVIIKIGNEKYKRCPEFTPNETEVTKATIDTKLEIATRNGAVIIASLVKKSFISGCRIT